MTGTCGGCRWWAVESGPDVRRGMCCRYPPSAFPVEEQVIPTRLDIGTRPGKRLGVVAVRPATDREMFCGEWAVKE